MSEVRIPEMSRDKHNKKNSPKGSKSHPKRNPTALELARQQQESLRFKSGIESMLTSPSGMFQVSPVGRAISGAAAQFDREQIRAGRERLRRLRQK